MTKNRDRIWIFFIAFVLLTGIFYSSSQSVFAAKSGWACIGNDWMYRAKDGEYEKSKWLKLDENWYYFDSDGYMKTGWIKLGGNWYYLDSDGVMQTGWKNIDGSWYYLNENGAMQTGWLQEKDDWYYLESDGSMAVGRINIEGTKYMFDGYGKLIADSFSDFDFKTDGWKNDGEKRWYQYEDCLLYTSRPFDAYLDFNVIIKKPKDYSFPSGHTAAACVMATVFVYMAGELHMPFVGIVAVVYALLMGFSRIYLLVHYFTDVLAGAGIGIFCGLVVLLIFS